MNCYSEQKILAAIAQIGFPAARETVAPVVKRRRTLRSVGYVVIFFLRVKYVVSPLASATDSPFTVVSRRASDAWREQAATKDAITAAYQEVRRRKPIA